MNTRLRELVRWLRRRLGGPAARLGGAYPRPVVAAAGPPAQTATMFERSLRDLLSSGGKAMSGRVHFLNLQKIREKAAAIGRLRDDVVHQLISGVIQRHLEPRDFFTRYGEDSYILIFRALTGAEANLKCVLIAREVSQRLLGADADPEALDVRVAVAAADGSIVLQSVSITDAIAGVLAGEAKPLAAVESAIPVPLEGSPDWRAFSMAREPPELATGFTERRGAGGVGASTPQPPSFLDVLREAETESTELEKALFEQRRREKEAAEAAARSRAAVATADRPDAPEADELDSAPAHVQEPIGEPEVRLLYRPVLNVAASTTAAYAAVLVLMKGGTNVTNDPHYAPVDDPVFAASMDRVLLRKVLPDLVRTAEGELHHLLIIPVRPSTLFRSASRLEHLRLCDLIPEKWRRFVVWELVASGVGLLDTQVLPAVATLKPFGRSVLLRTSLDFSEFSLLAQMGVFSLLAQMGVHAVGVDLGEAPLPEAEVAGKFARFARQARTAGLRAYATGCFSDTLLAAATAAGATYLSGHAVASRVERPEGIVPSPRLTAS